MTNHTPFVDRLRDYGVLVWALVGAFLATLAAIAVVLFSVAVLALAIIFFFRAAL